MTSSTVCVEGSNDVRRGSRLDKGQGGYVLPNSSPRDHGGNVEDVTAAPVGGG